MATSSFARFLRFLILLGFNHSRVISAQGLQIDPCKEYFPQVAVGAVNYEPSGNSRVVIIETNVCQAKAIEDFPTNANWNFALNAKSSILCARPESSVKFSCWDSSNTTSIYIKGEEDLPEPFSTDFDFLLELDPYSNNVYWKQWGSPGPLFVTSLKTRISKAILFSPGNLMKLAVDTKHGFVFGSVADYIFQAPIANPAPGELLKIVTFTRIQRLAGMAADVTNMFLYWFQTENGKQQIRRLSYGNKHVDEVYTFAPSSLNVVQNTLRFFRNTLYWIRKNSTNYHVLNKLQWESKREDFRPFNISNCEIRAMQINENDPEFSKDPCEAMQCSHLCLPIQGKGSQCACPSYMKISGRVCTSDPLVVLLSGSVGRNEKKNTVIFKQTGDQIGLPDGTHLPPPSNMNEMAGIQAFIDSQFCYKTSTEDVQAFRCVDTSPSSRRTRRVRQLKPGAKLEVLLQQVALNGTRNHRIISVHTDGKNGFVFSLDEEHQCVHVLNIASGMFWKAFCPESLDMDLGFVDIDPLRWILFYRSKDFGEILKVDLQTQETEMLVIDKDITGTNSNGTMLCADVRNQRIFWIFGNKLSWISYSEGTVNSFTMSESTTSVKGLKCSSGRPYWTETDSTGNENIVTFDVELGIAERIFRGRNNQTIFDFRFASSFDHESGKNSNCFTHNCSHGCARAAMLEFEVECFCPSGMVLKTNTTCGYPNLLATIHDKEGFTTIQLVGNVEDERERANLSTATRRENPIGNESHIAAILTPVPEELKAPATVPIPFDVAFSKHNKTLCWQIKNVLSCKCNNDSKKFIGFANTTSIIFALNPEGTHLMWSSDDNGALKITHLGMNKTLTFGLFDIRVDSPSLVAFDVSRATVFWCDNTENKLMMKVLHDDESKVKVLYTWTHSKFTSENCTAIATDPFGERVFFIWKDTIMSLHYVNFGAQNQPMAVNISTLGYDAGRSMFYKNHALYWISGFGDLQVLDVDVDTTKNRSLVPSLFGKQNRTMTMIKSLDTSIETQEHEVCASKKCPIFCFLASPGSTAAVDAICACPDNQEYNSKSKSCQKKSTALSGTQVLVIVVTTLSVLSTILIFSCVVICVRMRRRKDRPHSHVLEFLKGELSSAEVKNSDSYSRIAFTKVVNPKDLAIYKSEVLGEGCFGIVYAGVYQDKPVAVKTLKPGHSNDLFMEFVRELKVMLYVGEHENVVQFLGAEISQADRGFVWVVLEKSPIGSLQNYLRKHANMLGDSKFLESTFAKNSAMQTPSGSTLPAGQYQNVPNVSATILCLPNFLYWSKQIANGMAYLESKNIVHGDLSARNILVFNDNVVKISDFGYSRNLYQYSSYLKQKEAALPWRWAAVETLEQMEFSLKSDVWAYAVTLWEIFSLGNVPFPQMVWSDEFVSKVKRGYRLKKPDLMPDSMYSNILTNCWHIQPDLRPSFTDVLTRLNDMYATLMPKRTNSVTIDYDYPKKRSLVSRLAEERRRPKRR